MEEIIKTLSFSSIAWQVITPLIFSGLDILTGYIQAVINKNVDSKIMREGLLHKCLLIVAIVIGYVVEYAFNLSAVASVITIYICVMEIMSIAENLKKAGLELKIFDILKNKKEEYASCLQKPRCTHRWQKKLPVRSQEAVKTGLHF